VTRQELHELKDRLYLLAQTVDDVERDLTDDEDDERRLLNVLLYAAKQAVEQDTQTSPAPAGAGTR